MQTQSYNISKWSKISGLIITCNYVAKIALMIFNLMQETRESRMFSVEGYDKWMMGGIMLLLTFK